MIYIISQTPTPTADCLVKLDLLSKFLISMANLLPTTPPQFHFNFLLEKIDLTVPWGFGFLVRDLLSGVVEYLVIIVSWKFLKLFITIFASKFL
jgi:hypothetical protein